MSYKLMDQVLDAATTCKQASQAVLLSLARRAGDDGKNAYPSIATLARETHAAERTVRRALRDLEEADLIIRRGLGTHGTWIYDLNLAALTPADLTAPANVTPPDKSTAPGQIDPSPRPICPPTPAKLAPKRSLKGPEKSLDAQPRVPGENPDEIYAIFAAWIEATNRTTATALDKKRRQIIQRAINDMKAAKVENPTQDVLDAVKGVRLSQHHMSNKQWCELKVILRDTAQIEHFRDLHRTHATRPARVSDSDLIDLLPGNRDLDNDT